MLQHLIRCRIDVFKHCCTYDVAMHRKFLVLVNQVVHLLIVPDNNNIFEFHCL